MRSERRWTGLMVDEAVGELGGGVLCWLSSTVCGRGGGWTLQ